MKNDSQAPLDLFTNYSDFALTNDELLAIHGGTTGGSGDSNSSSSDSHSGSSHHGGGGGGDGGGFGGGGFGMPAPPPVIRGVQELQRGGEALRDAGLWLLEKGADSALKAIDASGLLKTPFLEDHIVPPKPQA